MGPRRSTRASARSCATAFNASAPERSGVCRSSSACWRSRSSSRSRTPTSSPPTTSTTSSSRWPGRRCSRSASSSSSCSARSTSRSATSAASAASRSRCSSSRTRPTRSRACLAILVAVAVGALIGAFQGSFVALLGVPSFVVTLAGLLAWQGGILQALGTQGVITIQDSTVINVSNYSFSDTWGWGLAGRCRPAVRRGRARRRVQPPARGRPDQARLAACPPRAARRWRLLLRRCDLQPRRRRALRRSDDRGSARLLDVHREANAVRPARVRSRGTPKRPAAPGSTSSGSGSSSS